MFDIEFQTAFQVAADPAPAGAKPPVFQFSFALGSPAQVYM